MTWRYLRDKWDIVIRADNAQPSSTDRKASEKEQCGYRDKRQVIQGGCYEARERSDLAACRTPTVDYLVRRCGSNYIVQCTPTASTDNNNQVKRCSYTSPEPELGLVPLFRHLWACRTIFLRELHRTGQTPESSQSVVTNRHFILYFHNNNSW